MVNLESKKNIPKKVQEVTWGVNNNLSPRRISPIKNELVPSSNHIKQPNKQGKRGKGEADFFLSIGIKDRYQKIYNTHASFNRARPLGARGELLFSTDTTKFTFFFNFLLSKILPLCILNSLSKYTTKTYSNQGYFYKGVIGWSSSWGERHKGWSDKDIMNSNLSTNITY